jgi:hypothetical protein
LGEMIRGRGWSSAAIPGFKILQSDGVLVLL